MLELSIAGKRNPVLKNKPKDRNHIRSQLVLRRRRQVDRSRFEVSLIYIRSFRAARAIKRDPSLKTNT